MCEFKVIVFSILITIGLSSVVPSQEFEFTDNYIGVPTIEGYQPANNSGIQTRIRGGKPARPGQIPYQVGIFVPKNPGSRFGSSCGGTLISSQYILTAAHCIVESNDIDTADGAIVTLGTNNRRNPYEPSQNTINVPKQNLIKHPGYNDPILAHDIALIKLPNPVEFNEFIQPADLPSHSLSQRNLAGRTITSSGWGITGGRGSSHPNILQYMQTTILNGIYCEMYGKKTFDNERQICINAPGRSTCQGDSGGPHIFKTNCENTVVGVTSYGYTTCDAGYPQVLTRVGTYLNWISQNTGIKIKYF